jgi:hypothetical protein
MYHIDNFTRGKLPLLAEQDDKFVDRDYDILDLLSNVRSVSKRNFRDMALGSEHDVLVFVYTSDMNHP